MAATADPRAKPPPTASSHHLKPWAPPRAHCVPSLPDVSDGGARDRRRSSSSSSRRSADASAEEEEPRADRLEDLRAKLMGHLRDAADRLRLPLPPPPSVEPEPDPEPPAARPPPLPTPPQLEAPASRPWNLRDRKRRPSARAAAAAAAASFDVREPSADKSPSDDRAPFSVALTADEVQEDIYALTGARPRRRPRKRPRVVQRQLDTLFPGLWLTEITADAYKVPDE